MGRARSISITPGMGHTFMGAHKSSQIVTADAKLNNQNAAKLHDYITALKSFA